MHPPNSQERPVAISPAEVARLQQELMPPEVIETFNRFIGEKALNGHAIIYQEDVVKDLIRQGIKPSEMFEKGLLNIEDIYEEAGWKVEYDSPAYDEGDRAYFTFTAKEK